MSLPFQIENKILKFLNPKIYFTIVHNQYLYDNHWLIEMTKETFKKESLEIIKLINNHLIVGLNTKTFLKETLLMISFQLDKSQEESLQSFEFIENIKVINYCRKSAPDKEKFMIEDILKGKESVINSINNEFSYYYDLQRFAKDFNNYIIPADIEKVKLKFVLELHYEYMNIIYGYIDCIIQDFDRINFEKFDFEDILINFQLINSKASSEIIQKCNVNLNKIDVANLFYFLMEEKLFFFHKNEKQNKIAIQQFIEENFTYKDDDARQKNISNINKEFSKVGYSNEVSHINFINTFISILEERKSRNE